MLVSIIWLRWHFITYEVSECIEMWYISVRFLHFSTWGMRSRKLPSDGCVWHFRALAFVLRWKWAMDSDDDQSDGMPSTSTTAEISALRRFFGNAMAMDNTRMSGPKAKATINHWQHHICTTQPLHSTERHVPFVTCIGCTSIRYTILLDD